jgi:hypothetical protein
MKLLFFSLLGLVFFVSIDQSYAQTYSASLSLDQIPSHIKSGDEIIFSGRLITSDGKYVIPDRTIYIKDDVDFGSDAILGSIVTDANGEFSTSWTAVSRDSGSYDFYAVFEGDDYVQKARSKTFSVYVNEGSNSNKSGSSGSNSNTNQQYQNYYETQITLDKIQSSVFVGESIMFTGKLSSNGNPVSNVVVKIMEDDPLSPDQLLSAGRTDSSGRFLISWQTSKGLETDFDIYAVFDGDSNYLVARSHNQILSVERHTGSITLDPIPSSAKIGQPITFSGTLKLDGINPEGAIVYIKDEDMLNPDDLIVTVYVDRNGKFSATWFATEMDPDEIVDIFAVFEGDDAFDRLTTCDSMCSQTIPLYISGTYVPPVSTPPVDTNNGYMKLYQPLDFPQRPRIAIVPSPDSYDIVKSHIIPAEEGVLMWKSQLAQKYGGDWNVDFNVINPGQSRFENKPDIIMNIITTDKEIDCKSEAVGLSEITNKKPVQTWVCSTYKNEKRSNSDVSATSAHEFIHAIGLGHTWNKQGDLMCSAEKINGQWTDTCPNYSAGKSKIPSELNLSGVIKLYGVDGFKNPNNKVTSGTKISSDSNVEKKTTTTTTSKTTPKPKQNLPDTDGDGIPDSKDRCKTKPETHNGYKDTDGCPDKKPKK